MALWAQVSFTFRSAGILALVRAAARKAFFPLMTYQRFLLLEAPVGPVASTCVEDPLCEVQSRHRPLDPADVDWPEGEEAIRRYVGDSGGSRLRLAVARDQRGIIGVCLYEMDVVGLPGHVLRAPVRSYFVHFIGVHDRARGQGVMARLLACADRDAMSAGARSRVCLVASHNRASLRGFGKSGARSVGSVRVIRILGIPAYVLPAWLRRDE
jgi:GNAT superfamily N-acetyltransferase